MQAENSGIAASLGGRSEHFVIAAAESIANRERRERGLEQTPICVEILIGASCFVGHGSRKAELAFMIPVTPIADGTGVSAPAENLGTRIYAAGIEDGLNAGVGARQVVVRAHNKVDHTGIEVVSVEIRFAADTETMRGLHHVAIGGKVSDGQAAIEIHMQVFADRDLRADSGGQHQHAYRDRQPDLPGELHEPSYNSSTRAFLRSCWWRACRSASTFVPSSSFFRDAFTWS